MSTSAQIFCPTCGAANNAQDSVCFACGQPLQLSSGTTGGIQLQLLKQRYRLITQLGQGGMGAVYKAEDRDLGNRVVAIKELSQRGLNAHEASEAARAFKQEALLLAGLMHTHLPRIYDHFIEGGRWYLVMDFIEGQTLESYLSQHPEQQLPLPEALDYALQLCTVLEYLHTRQPPVIFRDLKPSNIMRSSDGQLYLIDFGIARHFKPGQLKDTVAFGSPGYAAPEQYGKTQTTPQADLYSLGAILHQMITGQDPSITPFFFAPLPFTLAPLQHILTQLLTMDAQQRPASVKVVQQKLQEIAANPVTSPLPVSNPAGPVKGPLLYLYTRHIQRISSVAWSPDGQLIASASFDGTIQVWNASTGELITMFEEHRKHWRTSYIYAACWSPDGKMIASAGADEMVRLWEPQTARVIRTYMKHRGPVRTLAWSPDGGLLASSHGPLVHVWHPSNKAVQLVYNDGNGIIHCLAWSPDSQRLLYGGENQTLLLHTIALSDSLPTRLAGTYRHGTIEAVSWSPDGSMLATAGADSGVMIWDVHSSSLQLYYQGHRGPVRALAWFPDGIRIASASEDATVHIWDRRDGKRLYTYELHHAPVYTLALSPHSELIASGDDHNNVHVWRYI